MALIASKANGSALNALKQVVGSCRPIALAGAGISVDAGFPSWAGLLDELEAELPEEIASAEYVRELGKVNDALWRAQEYRRFIPARKFSHFLARRFAARPQLETSSTPVLLVKLPFRHFLTTNYDDVLSVAHATAGLPAPRALNWSRDDDIRELIFALRDDTAPRYVMHLHGRHDDPASIILTDNDYVERYVRNADTARRLFAVFATERVVFVGFSLSDPDLMALLRQANATMRADDPRHYALLPLEQNRNELVERNRLRYRYGVEPVFYESNGSGRAGHEGLSELLVQLQPAAAKGRGRRALAEKRSLATLPQEIPPEGELDPDDVQKGRWGGSPEANGRRVTARVVQLEPSWFETTLTVESTDDSRPLAGEVAFHVHQSFPQRVHTVKVKNGVATLSIESYGAFTVGVSADGGETKLELDLSTLKDAPRLFRLS